MKKSITLLLIGFALSLSAQTNLDSLYSIWEDETQADSTRAKAYYDYIWEEFLFSNTDSALTLANELLAFGKERNNIKAQDYALSLKGRSYFYKSQYPEALDFFGQSLKIKKQLNDSTGIASMLGRIGYVLMSQGNLSTALNYLTKSLKIHEELGNQVKMAQTYQEIGSLYFLLDDFSKGFDYLQQTLTIYQQSDDQVRIARTHHFIGSIHLSNGDLLTALSSFDKTIKIYTELENKDGIAATLGVMGRAYTEQGNYPKAIEKFEESLRISKESNSQYGIATALVHIGAIYGKEGKYSKAHEYYSQGLKIFEELNDPSELTAAFVYIGMLYNKQNDYSRTIEYCTKGYKLALSTGAVLDQKEACQCLYETYKAMGNSNEALVYLEKINAAEDSLDTQEASKKLQQMEFTKQRLQDSIAAAEQNRLVQEAHQEEIREGEKTRNLFAGGGLLVLLLAGGLYTRNRFIKKSRDTISKEKNRSENLLLNILPEVVAEELKEKGHADAQLIEHVSVLFTDFRGFTAMSEQLSPKDLVNDLNICFSEFDRIIAEHNIEKIKTIGDAYMAAGGLPIPNTTHAADVVQAAFKMRDFVEAGKARKIEKGLPYFEIRIGIHTGPVVAGIVGVKKFQYDIWGDTVNTASRMESSGEVGKVNISQATYKLLKNDPNFSFEGRGKIEAKGKGEIDMWFVEKN